MDDAATPGEDRLAAIRLDPGTLPDSDPQTASERRAAIRDLLAQNIFVLDGGQGPYELDLAMRRGRLVFAVQSEGLAAPRVFDLRLTPFLRTIRDYVRILDTYDEVMRTATVTQIEAVDAGRRNLHDEAADRLIERLAARVEMDKQTARRLFTLICALVRRPRTV